MKGKGKEDPRFCYLVISVQCFHFIVLNLLLKFRFLGDVREQYAWTLHLSFT